MMFPFCRKMLLIAGLVSLFMLSCSLPSSFSIFPPTPTSTPTATNTNTSTSTSTQTPTPLPPVQIIPCLSQQEDCAYARSVSSFLPPGDILPNAEYSIDIRVGEAIHIFTGWCAVDRGVLDRNLEHIEFIFTIDGYSYVDSLETGYFQRTDENGSAYMCYGMGGALTNWQLYQNHRIKIGFKIKSEISDGWKIYLPAQQVNIYYFKPFEATLTPTFTRTPTFTFTPTRTRTRTPAPAIYFTPTPPCSELSPLYIHNNTNGYISLNLNGVAKYSFWLAPGDHTLWICPGSYSYVASGCGGSSISGTISAGEEHEFYCR